MYSKPKNIGLLEIKNRFVRSATFEAMATEDGYVTDKLVGLYKALAEGGVGLIISGLVYIQSNGQIFEHQAGIHKDEFIPGFRKITEIVHKYGDNCKIALQIGHCGRQSRVVENTIAPSAVLEKLTKKLPREMTIEEIQETIDAFAQGIRRAKEAGFDAVQFHAAHGWLLSEFLSPYTNRRTDEYGGSTENRVKIIEDIYKKSVELVGKDFPILIKMNADDFVEGGITLEESKKIAEKFSKIGLAAIEISGCMWDTVKRRKEEIGWKATFIPESRVAIGSKNKEAYHLPYAKEIKRVIDVPLILVGGINSLDLVEKILTEGSADFISLSRPLIREPDLPNRWLKRIGDPSVDCIYCNSCLSSLMSGGLRCVKKEKK